MSSTTEDVAHWLAGLGFNDYSASFVEQKVDGKLLLHLTDQDLRDLGVSRLGDRHKLLSEIAALSHAQVRSKFRDAARGAVKRMERQMEEEGTQDGEDEGIDIMGTVRRTMRRISMAPLSPSSSQAAGNPTLRRASSARIAPDV